MPTLWVTLYIFTIQTFGCGSIGKVNTTVDKINMSQFDTNCDKRVGVDCFY